MSINDAIIGGKYRLVQKIGQGSFGKVYSAYDLEDANRELKIAVKTESLS